jgi:hypothetical protein
MVRAILYVYATILMTAIGETILVLEEAGAFQTDRKETFELDPPARVQLKATTALQL